MLLQPTRIVVCGLSALTAIAALTYGGRWLWVQVFQSHEKTSSQRVCLTIVTDPNPPLNVRSSPILAPDNIVSRLQNGTQVSVVGEHSGWLKINVPVDGWIFGGLTVNTCTLAAQDTSDAKVGDVSQHDANILAVAEAQYQGGNYEAAIALLKAIQPTSTTYEQAQARLAQFPGEWRTAESQYRKAELAFKARQWSEVLKVVEDFPDIRYWRERLTPLVTEAIAQQQEASGNTKTERLALKSGDRVSLSGRFDGPGRHRYILTANKQQTITITAQADSVMPTLRTPTGQQLDYKNQGKLLRKNTWLQVLDVEGDYTLDLDSYYNGYSYRFDVELK
jgi:hypothetical protein